MAKVHGRVAASSQTKVFSLLGDIVEVYPRIFIYVLDVSVYLSRHSCLVLQGVVPEP